MIQRFVLFFMASFIAITLPAKTQDTAFGNTLIINEFMAANATCLMDEDNEFSDWIEIYNPTSSDIRLSGWSLSANKAKPRQWNFPNMTLGAGEYLIVFASSKKRAIAGKELHTNFKLSSSGEYLALVSPQGSITTMFESYPSMEDDVSYGFLDEQLFFFTQATPNAANSQSQGIRLPRPVMSVQHGFYNQAFSLSLTCDIPNASIYYTSDGSEPSASNGKLYQKAIDITTTSVIRAIAISSNKRYTQSKIATQSYLFTADIVKQSNSPKGYPDKWGPYATRSGTAIADYEMDPEMTKDDDFVELLKTGLLSLPALSIVTDKGNLFNQENDATTGGIYIYTDPPTGYTKTQVNDPGTKWMRPASFELFDVHQDISLQEDCGIRLHGGHSRLAEKSPKHSFRLAFKPEYGTSKLNYPLFGEDGADKLDNIVLRAGFCNTWIHANTIEREKATYTRDTWAKTTQQQMGYPASHFIYAHLFINGLYWGLYNPTERIDNTWCETYLGGDKEEYDVIKVEDSPQEVLAGDGNMEAWKKMFELAALASDEAVYQKMQGNNADGTPNADYPAYLDVVNFIDYMIINIYGGNTDWDRHNWLAVRNRVNPGKGFQFICWDSEHMLKTLDQDVGYGEMREYCPSVIFDYLMKNKSFCRLVANRIQKHCFGHGVLTPEVTTQIWLNLSKQISTALHDESARWGDYRRDVHSWSSSPYELYTKATHYDPIQKELLETILPQRRDVFVGQMRKLLLFPEIDAPIFSLNHRDIEVDTFALQDTIRMTAPKGIIYYTLDSSDPVEWNNDGSGNVSSSATVFSDKILLTDSSICIKARTFSDNQWSAMNELSLSIPTPPVLIEPDPIDTLVPNPIDTIPPQPDGLLLASFDISILEVSPNPFFENFLLHYELAEEAMIRIELFDLNGRRIDILENELRGGGSHRIEYDASALKTGVYFCRFSCIPKQGNGLVRQVKLIKL